MRPVSVLQAKEGGYLCLVGLFRLLVSLFNFW